MKTETTAPTPATELKSRWDTLLVEKPKLRIRDAARELGVTEVELLATGCGANVQRLQGPFEKLIADLPKLGRVMCLTRNDAAVHERFGEFRKIDFFHGMGQVVGEDIDLRLFMKEWQHGFAVSDETPDGDRQSFQFFDAHGTAIHKIYLQAESNYGGYGVLLDAFRSSDQSTEQKVEPAPRARPLMPDAEIDVAGFQQAWKDLKDTHAFFMLLGKFRVGREQALRLAPEGFAKRLSLAAPKTLLEQASTGKLPIMVFIGSPGVLQIHTGNVDNIKMFGPEWLNVLDDEFNMHLHLPQVASAWMVRKPTVDGIVTSVELYDAKGDSIVIFFGKRKPGNPEDETWRQLAEGLETL